MSPDSLSEWLAEVDRNPTAAHATVLARLVRAVLDTPIDLPGPRPDLYLDGFRSASMRAHSRVETTFWSAISDRTTTTGGTS